MDLNLLIIVPLLTSLVLLFCNGLNQLRNAAFLGSVVQLGLAIWLFVVYHWHFNYSFCWFLIFRFEFGYQCIKSRFIT